jgi:hypothetical protein
MERDEMQREKHENTKISFGNIFVVVLVFQALGHCRSRITRAEYFQYRGARTACYRLCSSVELVGMVKVTLLSAILVDRRQAFEKLHGLCALSDAKEMSRKNDSDIAPEKLQDRTEKS